MTLAAPLSPSIAACATYDVNLTLDLQSGTIDTGLGLFGVTNGVVSPFFSFQAGDTINFGTVTLGAFPNGDQYLDEFVELGVLDVSYTPYVNNFAYTPGGAGFLGGCNENGDPNCIASVQAIFASYVPQPNSLIFTIPEGATGIQLAFTDPFTYTAPTPIPAALPLFATGLGALGLLGWRKNRKARAA